MRYLLTLLFWVACLAIVASAAPLNGHGNAGDVALKSPTWSPSDSTIRRDATDVLGPNTAAGKVDNTHHLIVPAPHVRIVDLPVVNPNDPRGTATPLVPPTESLQILYNKYGTAYRWYMYQGPQGIPVNPCGDTRFKLIAHAIPEVRIPHSFEDPPFPSAGYKWPVSIPPLVDCRYESDPKGESAGSLLCGDRSLIYPFLSDPGRAEATILCQDGQFKRAWYVEY